MTRTPLSGLVPILATPFQNNGDLDLASLRRLIEFQLTSEVDGIALFGLASEGFALTTLDRDRVLAEAVSVVAGAVPIVAGVGATSTITAIEQGRSAVEGGADALMVLPPFMVKPSAAQTVDFYGAVAQRTGADVMVQDAPGVSGVTMSIQTIQELSELAGVTSIKVESPPTPHRVRSVADAVQHDFEIFGGQNAQMLLEEYAAGSRGTMPACEFADVLVPVLRAWSRGERDLAESSFARLLPLILFGLQPGLAWSVHKEVLVMRGIIDSACVRAPAATIDTRTRLALNRIVERLELIGPVKM